MEKHPLLDFSEFISIDVHAVFSQNLRQDSLSAIAASLGFSSEKIASPEQVHSAQVDLAESPGEYLGMDGLVTQNPDIVLTLKVADCVPVYLYEPCKKMIGMVHSGWRGTVEKIVPNTIQLMLENGAETGEIRCFLGPAIGICCYEVNGEVAHKFDAEATIKLENACPPFSVDQNDQRRGKWKVGLHEQISLQLAAAGIPEENIQTSDMCTYESQDCHSYRRDGENAGRMFAFLELKH